MHLSAATPHGQDIDDDDGDLPRFVPRYRPRQCNQPDYAAGVGVPPPPLAVQPIADYLFRISRQYLLALG